MVLWHRETRDNIPKYALLKITLQKSDKEKVAAPAEWRPGQDVIIPAAGSCGSAKSGWRAKTKISIAWTGSCAFSGKRNSTQYCCEQDLFIKSFLV